MSFLAPLFLLGAAAVALPIIFHLIRRTTREKVPFSSLMFLTPSPPRLTKKSRLENILLLLLRCAVITLLAIAFARPFFRKPLAAQPGNPSRRTVILLDASASMRRADLWTDARGRAQEVADKAAPTDELALLVFDRQTQTMLSFQDWNAAAPSERARLVAQRLATLTPGWAGTHLGSALLEALELIEHDANQATKAAEIVVITDLQGGANLDGLQGFDWPANTKVSVAALKARRPTNAGLQLLPDPPNAATLGERLKIRVSNSADSKKEQFQVRWHGAITSAVPAYVPPGQSRILELPRPAAPDQLLLTGDEEDFDNAVAFVPQSREQINVLYFGDAAENDPQRMLFYLKRALVETARQQMQVVALKSDATFSIDTNAALFVIDAPLTPAVTPQIQGAIRAGRTALVPLASAAMAGTVADLAGVPVTAAEAPSSGYAMFGEINFTHPLFAPFADARFSDFTKIYFWKHRRLDFEASPGARIVARFDDGTPAIAQFQQGAGSVFAFASGWHPADSQLALSSKFVPLLYSLLELGGALKPQHRALTVGDTIDLESSTAGPITVRKPDGTEVSLEAGETKFSATDLPGTYTITSAQPPSSFAVHVAPEETRTAPLAIEELQRLGVPLQATLVESPERTAQKQAQLHAAELESRQKLWRWLIAATLVLLMTETWMAARLSRRAAVPAEAAT